MKNRKKIEEENIRQQVKKEMVEMCERMKIISPQKSKYSNQIYDTRRYNEAISDIISSLHSG